MRFLSALLARTCLGTFPELLLFALKPPTLLPLRWARLQFTIYNYYQLTSGHRGFPEQLSLTWWGKGTPLIESG
jgi:hypothetical protein